MNKLSTLLVFLVLASTVIAYTGDYYDYADGSVLISSVNESFNKSVCLKDGTNCPQGAGTGTVTSVSTTGPYLTGGPITTTGTISINTSAFCLASGIGCQPGGTFSQWRFTTDNTGFYIVTNNTLLKFLSGSGISITNDTTGNYTITSTITQYTDALAANAVQNTTLVRLGDANKTLVYCGNITGATSNLCTITSGGGGGGDNSGWVNSTGSVALWNTTANVVIGVGSAVAQLYINQSVNTTQALRVFGHTPISHSYMVVNFSTAGTQAGEINGCWIDGTGELLCDSDSSQGTTLFSFGYGGTSQVTSTYQGIVGANGYTLPAFANVINFGGGYGMIQGGTSGADSGIRISSYQNISFYPNGGATGSGPGGGTVRIVGTSTSSPLFTIIDSTATPRLLVTANGTVGFGTSSPSLTSQVEIDPRLSTMSGLVIKAGAGQSANLQEWQNSNGSVQAQVGAEGYYKGGSTVSNPLGLPVNFLNNGSAIFYASNTTATPLVVRSGGGGFYGIEQYSNANARTFYVTDQGALGSQSSSLSAGNLDVNGGTNTGTISIGGSNVFTCTGSPLTCTLNTAGFSQFVLKQGNFGIGMATPTQKLDVNGSVNVTSKIYVNGLIGSGHTVCLNSTDNSLYLSTIACA